MVDLNINTFGVLKDFFSESFILKVKLPVTVQEIVDLLIDLEPEAKKTLLVSRIAIHENLVALDYKIEDISDVYLLPPSSGG